MVQEVRSLNPKPGNAFGSVVIQPIVPDVIVRAAPDGAWLVELNSEMLPRVLVNQQYYAKVIKGAGPETDKIYLSDCLSNATWLVRSLDQRARTILKVAREIVRQQDGFLVAGIAALRPLNLRTVADAIAMHESTVSRVTANKYMATPRGTFGFKYFFTTAIASAHGEPAHSAESVRHRIREMIDAETRGDHPVGRCDRRLSAGKPASISPAERSQNIAKSWALPRRCSAGAKNAWGHDPPLPRPGRDCDVVQISLVQTSRLATESAFSRMKSRRGSTTSPMSLVKMSSASSSSRTWTLSSERALTSSVVSHNCSGFISPRPL